MDKNFVFAVLTSQSLNKVQSGKPEVKTKSFTNGGSGCFVADLRPEKNLLPEEYLFAEASPGDALDDI